jgi:hypothetical protein
MSSTRLLYTNLLEQSFAYLLNGPPVTTGVINQWSNGSTSVTRAAGDYVADGIRRWALLSGNLAAKFPGGTRIQVIAPDELIMTAAATAGGSGTESATFTPDHSAAALAGYPMSNLQNRQRYVPWRSEDPPSGSDYFMEYDMGSAKTVAAAGYLAFDQDPLVGLSACTVQYGSTYGSWTDAVGLGAGSARDRLAAVANISARFWRHYLASFAALGVGALWLGVVQQDLGISFGPKSGFSRTRGKSMIRSGGGLPYYTTTGRGIRRIELDYEAIPAATWAKIEAVFDQTERPPILWDDLDKAYEVEWEEDRLAWSRPFTDLYQTRPTLEALP